MTDGPDVEPADAHLDLDTLADLDEGLTAAADSAAAERHLTGCRPCREQQARLRSTRALLGALPAEPMPPDVAGRLHEALARAPMSGTVLPLGAPPTGRRSRWRSRPTLAGLGAAAAVVALLAAVAVGAFQSSSNDEQRPNAPTTDSAAGGTQPSFTVSASGRNYNTANAHRLVQQLVQGASASGAGAVTPGASAGAQAAPKAPAAVDPALRPLYTSEQALLTCVAALSAGGSARLPLTIDFGTFTDKAKKIHRAPALVVVLPGPTGRADGWIVGPNCATAPDNNIYLFERVPVG